jgi:hypothetical protein
VEVLLASALFALMVTVFVGAYIFGRESSALSGTRNRANLLAEEGLEAARSIRDSGFANLIDGNHGLSQATGTWAFTGLTDTFDVFTRQVSISTISPEVKQIISTVSWQQTPQRSGQISLASRLANWRSPAAGNWAFPILDAFFNLTVANSGNNTANGLSIAYANQKAYLGRVNGGGREFFIFNVADPNNPILLGQRHLNGSPNDIVVNDNFAYIGSTDNASELQILDISDPATIANAGKLTTVDLTAANSGNATADAIALATDGSYLYMTRNGGSEFLIFDIQTNPANPGNPVGQTNALVGAPNDIVVNGNYVFGASANDAAELYVINVTNKTAPVIGASLNLNSGNNGANGLAIAFANNFVYLGRAASVAPEFYVINASNPLAPSLTGTLELGANVNGLAFDPAKNYAFAITADTANDFKVINASVPATPVLLSQLNLNNSPVDEAYAPDIDRVLVTSSDNNQELQIIAPQ